MEVVQPPHVAGHFVAMSQPWSECVQYGCRSVHDAAWPSTA